MSKARQIDKVLRMLEEYPSVTNIQLNQQVCYRYAARIHELRRSGKVIEREYVRPGVHRYRLVRQPVQMGLI